MMSGQSFVEQPIFLVGAERSGTTLLRLMLDHHPEVAFKFEFEFAVDHMHGGEFPRMDQYCDFLETDRIFQLSGFKVDKTLSYPGLVDSFLQQWKGDAGKPFIGATVHRDFDRLIKIWPDAKFIHLIRDPRDVARSCVAMNWAGNPWKGVERWLEAENLWDEFSKTLSPESHTEIHFESLVTNPVSSLTQICKLIGVEYDPAMFSYAETTTYDLPKASLSYQWRDKAPLTDIQQVEARVAGKLEDKDYSRSGLPGLSMTRWMQRRFKIQNALLVKLQRVRVYGLALVVASWLSQRLNLKSWQKKVALKSNEIDTVLMK